MEYFNDLLPEMHMEVRKRCTSAVRSMLALTCTTEYNAATDEDRTRLLHRLTLEGDPKGHMQKSLMCCDNDVAQTTKRDLAIELILEALVGQHDTLALWLKAWTRLHSLHNEALVMAVGKRGEPMAWTSLCRLMDPFHGDRQSLIKGMCVGNHLAWFSQWFDDDAAFSRDYQDDISEAIAKTGNFPFFKLAHEKGCNMTGHAVFKAIEHGHIDILAYAWEQNLIPYSSNFVSIAARYRQVACFRYLVEHGCHWHRGECNDAALEGPIYPYYEVPKDPQPILDYIHSID